MYALARRPGHASEPKLFLSRVDLRKMQLSEAVLTDTYLCHSNLAGGWIPGAYLDRSEMTDADLRKANLSGASMTHADLQGAYLQGADLRHAVLSTPTSVERISPTRSLKEQTSPASRWTARQRGPPEARGTA